MGNEGKKIQEIQIEKIKPNPYQMRGELDKESIKLLAKSIRERGLFNPISILKEKDEFIVISGHRRLEAFKLLKKETIPCFVKNRSENEELIIDLIHENLIREDLNVIEKASSIRVLISTIKSTKDNLDKMITLINLLRRWQGKAEEGKTLAYRTEKTKEFSEGDIFGCLELLKTIGISPSDAITYLSILKLPKNIQKEVMFRQGVQDKNNNGKISVHKAYQLTRIEDREFQSYLFEKAKTSNIHTIQALVDNHLKKLETGEWNGIDKKINNKGLKISGDNVSDLSNSCHRLSYKLSNFRVSKLIKISANQDREIFYSSMVELRKEIKWLDNAIKKHLIDKGYKITEEIEPFEVKICTTLKNPKFYNYRFSVPSRIIKALNITEPTYVKLKVAEVKKHG